jgi:hypothetical protein
VILGTWLGVTAAVKSIKIAVSKPSRAASKAVAVRSSRSQCRRHLLDQLRDLAAIWTVSPVGGDSLEGGVGGA